MNTSQPSFKCDETPTPTRFIRNCEEVGLFQDLQNNPFEETFRIAVETNTTQTLPEPLSKHGNADTLDTPQVVPNSKRIGDYHNSYPIIEDDDDIIKIPNNDFFLLSNDDELPLESSPLVQDIELIENRNNEHIARQAETLEKGVTEIDLTGSPILEKVTEQTYNFKPRSIIEEAYSFKSASLQNEVIEEIFFDKQEIPTDNSITNEFLVLHNKNNTKENSYSPAVLTGENVIFIPSKNHTIADNSSNKTSSKPAEPTESSVKQKLKKLLKPTQNNVIIPQPTPTVIQRSTSTTSVNRSGDTSDDKLSYSRERNRIAQKRCRLKKKKLITQLKQNTESVYSENKSLKAENVSLKAEIAQLKSLLLAHKDCPVTLAMCQANSSKVVAAPTNIPGIPITYAVLAPTTVTQRYQPVQRKINENKKLIMSTQNSCILPLNPIGASTDKSKPHPVERKQSLKVVIDENTLVSNCKPIVNSPNAVNVICYSQNQSIGVTEITDLTYDSS